MPDWKSQLESILRLIPGYDPWAQAKGVDAWLDHEAAVEAINFFADHLKHVEGATSGQPFLLSPWQAAIIGNLFGWKRRNENGIVIRRYRRALIYVPRGNGKTPLASGIVLYTFFCDGERGAQDYLAAGQREQAGFLFRNARGMIEQSEEMKDATVIYGGDHGGNQQRSIVLRDDPLSFIKVIPADAAGQHGGIPSVIVLDELHLQETRDLVDVFETGLSKKARLQPLFVMITTADYERESICNENHAHACRVRDNGGDENAPGYDPTFLPVIYEALAEEDFTDERVWARANPNLGVSVSLESLREASRKAQESPAYENTFRRLHLNQKTKQEMKLFDGKAWKRPPLDAPIASVDELDGKDCYAGLDLSSSEDLSSFTLAFPLPDEWLALLSFSWCPQEKIIRRAGMKFPYDLWARTGYEMADRNVRPPQRQTGMSALPNFLTATEGNWIDYRKIRGTIVELGQRFNIKEIGYDPHYATQLMQDLHESDGFGIVPITQGFRNLSAPTKELLRRVNLGKVIHFGNPVLAWAASNAAAHFDGKLPPGGKLEDHLDKVPIILSKRNSADKIDPIAAAVNALARMGEHPQEAPASGSYFVQL